MSEQAAGYSVTFTNRRALKSAIQTEIKRLSKTDSTNYTGPDPSLVRALVDDAGWQQSQVADLLGSMYLQSGDGLQTVSNRKAVKYPMQHGQCYCRQAGTQLLNQWPRSNKPIRRFRTCFRVNVSTVRRWMSSARIQARRQPVSSLLKTIAD